jgi:hypothetical protein
MDRKWIAVLLLIILLLNGCAATGTDISREEIIAAYEQAGYSVVSRDYDQPGEYGEIGFVKAGNPDGDYIYFSAFETPEQAKAYKKEHYHPMALGFFGSIFSGEIHLPKWKAYGCYVIEYENPAFLKPFEKLLDEK